ncbi:MAG: hypothetical protein ABII71_02060 [Candidatus Micrarchaeota archaeon]
MDRLMRFFSYVGFSLLLFLLATIPVFIIGAILESSGMAGAINIGPAYFIAVILYAIVFGILIKVYKRRIGKRRAAELDRVIWELHKKYTINVDTRLDLIEGERIVYGPTPCLIPDSHKRIFEVIVTNKRITIGIQPPKAIPGFESKFIFIMPIVFGEVNAWHKGIDQLPEVKSRLDFHLEYNYYPQQSRIRDISLGNDEIGDYVRVNWIPGSIVSIYHPHAKEIFEIFSSKMA